MRVEDAEQSIRESRTLLQSGSEDTELIASAAKLIRVYEDIFGLRADLREEAASAVCEMARRDEGVLELVIESARR